MSTPTERIARSFHAGMSEAILAGMPTSFHRRVEWDELDAEQRDWLLAAAQHVVDTLGLTPEFAVCFEDDGEVWLIGENRWTHNGNNAAADVAAQPAALNAFVGTAWTTRWERANG